MGFLSWLTGDGGERSPLNSDKSVRDAKADRAARQDAGKGDSRAIDATREADWDFISDHIDSGGDVSNPG